MPIAEATGAMGNTSCLVGTPEQVARALLEYYKIGIHSFLIRGFDPFEDTIDFGRELIPRLRAGAAELDRARRPDPHSRSTHRVGSVRKADGRVMSASAAHALLSATLGVSGVSGVSDREPSRSKELGPLLVGPSSTFRNSRNLRYPHRAASEKPAWSHPTRKKRPDQQWIEQRRCRTIANTPVIDNN